MTNFCGNLAPHDSHHIRVRHDDWPVVRAADLICPGEPLIEGGAECTLHQAPLAHCRCREERRQAHAT
jgi:hypothetical protein